MAEKVENDKLKTMAMNKNDYWEAVVLWNIIGTI